MPDFITPMLMIQQLQDLSHEILGTVKKVGRGRGRWKRKQTEEIVEKEENSKKELSDETKNARPETMDTIEKRADAEEERIDENPEDNTQEDSGNKVDVRNGNAEENGGKEIEKFQLTKTQKRKIAKFVSDLKSMMEGLFDEAEDDNLPSEEKASAQKLLLNISVK